MPSLLQDLRFSLRMLVKSPGFATLAVVALALGIGANTAIFSLVNAVLLRPTPGVHDPGRLVSLYRMEKNDPYSGMGFPDYADYRDRSRSFSGLAAQEATALSLGGGASERLIGDVVTGNYFEVLGVTAARGRLIGPEDDAPRGAHPVAVLSYALWQRKLGADPAVLGSKLVLNGYPFTVIGVAPERFAGTTTGQPYDVWVPMSMLDQAMPRTVGHRFFEERAWGWLSVFGRLKPDVSVEQAASETQGIARQLALAYPNTNADRTVAVVRGVGLDPDDRASLSGLLGLLFAGVGLLLLIACANVAGLLLVRAGARQREIAVRLALGASRGRVARQLLVEGLLLALAGGSLGLLLAPWAVRLALALTGTASTLRGADVSVDASVLAFTLGASVITGLAFALVPALRCSRPDLVSSLKQGTLGSGWRQSPLQRVLAAGQVALSFVLLMGAGLLLRSMRKIVSADPGFETRNVLLASVDLSLQGYSPARGLEFYRQVLQRLQGAPGVTAAAASTSVPPDEWPGAVSIFYPGQEPPQDVLRGHEFQLGLRVNFDAVSPGYFRSFGVPLLQGRDFTDQDGANAPSRDQDGNFQTEPAATAGNGVAAGVVIVNHKLAERLWPGQNPIGKRISWPTLVGPSRPPLEVVGVAADCKYLSLVRDAPLLMYVPLAENYSGRVTLIVRTASSPGDLAAVVRREINAVDANLPVYGVRTMPEQLDLSLWQQRMAASLISAFGALALLLATLGLYGVVAHSVAQRTREIGVRMALGAHREHILRLVLGQGMLLALAGVAVGMSAGVVLGRAVSSLLYGVGAFDAWTLAFSSLVLVAVTMLACYVPARRAAHVDPMVALRYE
ncbi:MAG TPA: ABC transporter permease [Terriglobia bacterium]|nr:ABC transporter permease [Terriglobia bacterium]